MRRDLRQRRPTEHPGLSDGLVTALTPVTASLIGGRARGDFRLSLRVRRVALLTGVFRLVLHGGPKPQVAPPPADIRRLHARVLADDGSGTAVVYGP